MAMNPRNPDNEGLDEEQTTGDWKALARHAKENPVLYSIAVGFIAFCALFGTLFRMNATQQEREITAQFARALIEESPADQVAALEPLTQKKTKLRAESLYMMGEAAYQARDGVKAEQAFERLRAEYPDFEYTPDAVEGLGFIAEERENYGEAVARYREVQEKWPEAFAGRRQGFNLGRAQERAENLSEAIESYRSQLELFPGSTVARRAQEALSRLRGSHEELFLAESAIVPDSTGGVSIVEADSLEDLDLDIVVAPEPDSSESAANEPAESEDADSDDSATEEPSESEEAATSSEPTP